MSPLSLADLQARLFSLIVAREAVPQELKARGLPLEYVTDHVQGDDRLDAVGRLDIYNGMYFFRLLEDVLEADYPAVKAVLGDDEFSAMGAAYLEACPSVKPSARYASERLPGFLSDWCPLRQSPLWLPALAALEWARVDAFDDVDDLSLAMTDIDPENLPALHLQTVRAHRTVAASQAIADVWRAVEDGEDAPVPEARLNTLLVWRQGAMVYHRELSQGEADLWNKLQGGLTFGDLCEHLGQTLSDEEAAQRAVQLLTAWINDGLLCATTASPSTQPQPIE